LRYERPIEPALSTARIACTSFGLDSTPNNLVV
jgi:hypothetical protein